ncbi:MAG TPA: ABA4-like family protein [Rhizomicrobium sp.]|nr:ABA4-like family protein [Rhizomicrobium sp.]
MSTEMIFNIANNGILVFWLLLIVAPRWRVTGLLVHSAAIPIVLGLTYTWLISRVLFLGEAPEGANFFSLAGVMAFFTSPVAATAGWIHYLVFDLFIGAWQTRDAQARGLSHFAVIPCLIVTLLAGPVGLLLYLAVRAGARKGGFSLAEMPA